MEALSTSRMANVPSFAVSSQRASLPSHQGLRLASQPSSQLSLKAVAQPKKAHRLNVAASAAAVAAAPVAVLPVLNFDGATAGEAELSLKTARPETAKGLVHRAVITFMQNKRRGTASTLTRAEVRGGGKKPFKQKGTGNARQGSRRTPLRPGGGVVFGPKPCDWSIKMNKKERRLAVGTALQSSAVSMTIIEDVNDSSFPIPKTRDFVAALERWGVDYKKDSALFITADLTPNVDLSSRNIQKLKVATPMSVNIYDVLRADKVVVTLSALALLNRRFGGAFEGEDDGGDEEAVVLRMVGGNLVIDNGEEAVDLGPAEDTPEEEAEDDAE